MARSSSTQLQLLQGAVDAAQAVRLAFTSASKNLLREWILVPIGILAMLLACFGIDAALRRASISFPASVACLVLLFAALLASETVLGNHRTRRMVAVLDVPAGWSLRWINVFFTPSFVLLPLSPPIGVVEVFKMIAVFIVGFVVMMILAAYLTRGLQLVIGSSKRAAAARAEELGVETDEIPIAQTSAESEPSSTTISESPSTVALGDLLAPPPSQAAPGRMQSVRNYPASEERATSAVDGRPIYAQVPLPPPRAQQWSSFIVRHLDWLTYATLFAFVGLPVYYSTGYAMPAQLTLSVLTYFLAMEVPPTWRQYLHPVLVSSLGTVLGIWMLAAVRRESLHSALGQYKTGAKYLDLWEHANTETRNPLPGAGDMFGSVLDASIVALALPMYQYRRELREHFLAIVVPNVLISIGSLFAYPTICFAIGVGATRSLAFAARSLTLALATPATQNLGGDVNTVAALAIMSGILGVLIGQRMLGMMKIPEDDYVTRGVTLGANSSAIATALLLRTDPRAAALSSLSMSLFGTITVLFTSIPSIANVVRSLVGL